MGCRARLSREVKGGAGSDSARGRVRAARQGRSSQLQPGRGLGSLPRRPCPGERCPGERFPGAAETGSKCPRPRLARSRCGGRSPAQPPPPPAAGSSSPPTSLVSLPARPIRSPGPWRAGRLSGRRRQSATLASRGARRLGTSATPGSPLCPLRPPPLHCRGDAPARAAPAAILLLFLPESRAPGSGRERAEAPGPAARGWRRRRRRRREVRVTPGGELPLQAEAVAASCLKAAAAAAEGAGARGLPGHGEESRTRGRAELGPVSLDLRVDT